MVTSSKYRVAQSFHRAAHHYDKAAALQQAVADELLTWMPPLLENGVHWLDLASGTGQCAKNAYGHVQWLLVDIAASMLSVARQAIAKPNYFFCQADFDAIPVGDQSFDGVLSSMALQWSMDLSVSLAEIHRVLKPQGKLLFSLPVAGTLTELQDCLAQLQETPRMHRFFSSQQVIDSLQAQGFMLVRQRMVNYHYTYPNVYALLKNIKAMGASQLKQREGLDYPGRHFFSSLDSLYRELYATDHDQVAATFTILFVEAKGL